MTASAWSKTRSSLCGKWFVTVIFDTPAASATWYVVVTAIKRAGRGHRSPATAGDADFAAWNGMYGRGQQAIEHGHRPLFDGPLSGSRMVLVDDDPQSAPPQSLRFVRPDVAIMVIPGVVTLAGQSATGPTTNPCRPSC
jgi:hypothetical protein